MNAIKSENRYFIAIIPPAEIYEDALALKYYFSKQYHSKAALNSPPHITLHMPFMWKEEKEIILIEKLFRFSAQQKPIEIVLHNFKAFSPRVIFIDVLKDEPLERLQKQLKQFCKTELNLFNADYKEFAYHPHITLAFRDLKKPAFYDAWAEFKEKKFEATFVANELVLLKHDGVVWNVLKTFSFTNPY